MFNNIHHLYFLMSTAVRMSTSNSFHREEQVANLEVEVSEFKDNISRFQEERKELINKVICMNNTAHVVYIFLNSSANWCNICHVTYSPVSAPIMWKILPLFISLLLNLYGFSAGRMEDMQYEQE